jgi:hypothetical protein
VGGGRGGPELAAELKALLPDELLDELLAGASTEEEITGPGGLLSLTTDIRAHFRTSDPLPSWAKALHISMGRAGLEPAPRGLKVRLDELQRTA